MARPESVAFGLSLASSSSELMNARMTSLESSSPPESMVTFIRFTAVSTCPVVILCQCPGISQCWLASSERTLLLQDNINDLTINLSANRATLSGSDKTSLPLPCSFFAWTLGCQSSGSRPSFGVVLVGEVVVFR